MIRQPLQHRIRQDHVIPTLRSPSRDIRHLEPDRRQPRPRRHDHLGRTIDPTHLRPGEPTRQHLGRIPRPTSQVDHQRRSPRNRRHQVPHRPRPIIFELRVERRRPTHPGCLIPACWSCISPIRANPASVKTTFSSAWPPPPGENVTSDSAVASSQTDRRGQEVRQASMVSPQLRSRAATHARTATTGSATQCSSAIRRSSPVKGSPA